MIVRIFALLSSLAGLVSRVLDALRDRRSREDGRREAQFEAGQSALASAEKAAALAEAAKQVHAKDPTDAAFDRDFWRD